MRAVSLLLLGLAAASTAFTLPEQQPLTDAVASQPVHTSDSWEYEDCGLSTDSIQIESIEVSPDPPKPGEDMTVTVTGIATEEIEDGAYADVVVKLGLIKILTKRFDICEEARNANATIQCPVEKGRHVVKHTVTLPKEIPKAKFSIDVNGYTADDADMVCVKLKVNFMKRFGLW